MNYIERKSSVVILLAIIIFLFLLFGISYIYLHTPIFSFKNELSTFTFDLVIFFSMGDRKSVV